MKLDTVRIDYERLCNELKKAGKTKEGFSFELGRSKSFVTQLNKNRMQPKALEKIMCILLGLDEGSLVVEEKQNTGETLILQNIFLEIKAVRAMMEEVAENQERIWNKLNTNTVQLERIKEHVKEFGETDYDKAVQFLQSALKEGKMNAEEIMLRSDAAGIKRADLNKAKRDIGVDQSTTGYGKNQKTWWFIPR